MWSLKTGNKDLKNKYKPLFLYEKNNGIREGCEEPRSKKIKT